MKLNCGPTWDEKHQAKKEWHRHFAWLPRRVGPRECIWLETVERKGKWNAFYYGSCWDWEYRKVSGQ